MSIAGEQWPTYVRLSLWPELWSQTEVCQARHHLTSTEPERIKSPVTLE